MIPHHFIQLQSDNAWTNPVPGPGRVIVDIGIEPSMMDGLGGTVVTVQTKHGASDWQDVASLTSAGLYGYPCEAGRSFRVGIHAGAFGGHPLSVAITCEPEIYFGDLTC